MKKVAFVLLTLLASVSSFASDAKVVCATAMDFEHAHQGINLSAASYAKAGYRLSAPVIRHDVKNQTVICITAAKN